MPIRECGYGCGKPFHTTSAGATRALGHKSCYDAKRAKNNLALKQLIEPSGGFAENAIPSPKREHPKGWEPRVEEHGNSATAVSAVTDNPNPDHVWLIEGWKLDPKQWRIVGHLYANRYQSNSPVIEDGKKVGYESRWLYQYKAALERIDPLRESQVAALIEEIKTHAPRLEPPAAGRMDVDDAFVVCIADSQMGKPDGDGSAGTTSRFLTSIEAVVCRIEELRSIGRPLGALYVFGLGDLIDNCDGAYEQQAFRTELDLREQCNVMRRLIAKAIERWAPLFSRVVIACVGGNHGEPRRGGKSYTTFADNFDVAIFDQLSDSFAMNEAAYGHVSFQIPKDELSMTLDVAGKIVGITHGHVIKNSRATASKRSPEASQVAKRVLDWWAQMAHGQHPVGDASILITGHYHHLLVTAPGAKTHIQCPALEGGSDWYRNQSGQKSTPGLLTLRIGKNVSPSGWADLQVV